MNPIYAPHRIGCEVECAGLAPGGVHIVTEVVDEARYVSPRGWIVLAAIDFDIH